MQITWLWSLAAPWEGRLRELKQHAQKLFPQCRSQSSLIFWASLHKFTFWSQQALVPLLQRWGEDSAEHSTWQRWGFNSCICGSAGVNGLKTWAFCCIYQWPVWRLCFVAGALNPWPGGSPCVLPGWVNEKYFSSSTVLLRAIWEPAVGWMVCCTDHQSLDGIREVPWAHLWTDSGAWRVGLKVGGAKPEGTGPISPKSCHDVSLGGGKDT